MTFFWSLSAPNTKAVPPIQCSLKAALGGGGAHDAVTAGDGWVIGTGAEKNAAI